jgi:hypothetical protein
MLATLRGTWNTVTPDDHAALVGLANQVLEALREAGLHAPSASKPLRAAHSSGQPVLVPMHRHDEAVDAVRGHVVELGDERCGDRRLTTRCRRGCPRS